MYVGMVTVVCDMIWWGPQTVFYSSWTTVDVLRKAEKTRTTITLIRQDRVTEAQPRGFGNFHGWLGQKRLSPYLHARYFDTSY